MKIHEIDYEQHHEIAALFEALALRQVMLTEGQLDEAGIWDKIKSAGSSIIGGVKTANDAVNRLGKLAQETKPVQNFDAQVDQGISKLAAANPKLADAARRYGDWAKKNPIKQSLILGAITAAASLAAGPAGGAAAGYVLRATNELLKGEKASTAVGKGLKTAAISGAAGAVVGSVANMLVNTDVIFDKIPGVVGVGRWHVTAMGTGRPYINLDFIMPERLWPKASKLWDLAKDAYDHGDMEKGNRIVASLKNMFDTPEYKQGIEAIKASNEQLYQKAIQQAETAKKVISGIIAGAQGGAAAATAADTQQPQTAQPKRRGGRAAGQAPSQTANAVRKRNARAAAKAAPGTVPSAEPGVAVQQPTQQGFKRTIAPQQPASKPTAQFVQPQTAQAKPMAKPQPMSTAGKATANFGAVGAQPAAQPTKTKRTKKVAEGVSMRLEV